MNTPKNNMQAIFNVSMRCLGFIVVAWVVYVAWHERFGRFMFFEQMDPPAADPHRTMHLRNAYSLIYGVLGILLGFISAIGADLRYALITATLGAVVFFVVRYRGIPEFFNPHSEEGYFGGPALLLSAASSIALLFIIRWVLLLRHSPTTPE